MSAEEELPESGDLWFIPLEGTMSADTLAHPERWMPYATNLGPFLSGPITFGPAQAATTDDNAGG